MRSQLLASLTIALLVISVDVCKGFCAAPSSLNDRVSSALRSSSSSGGLLEVPHPNTYRSCRPSAPAPAGTRRRTSTALNALAIDRTVALASVAATAKLLSSIGIGGMAARKANVLDAAAISALSRLTFWVFQPAFLLCSVSKTIYNASRGGLATRFLLLMPLTALLQIALGGLVGMALTKFQSFPDNEARAVRMCTTFANSGPLPLIFADALFGSNPSVLSEVAACVSFYLLVWSPLFWSYGRVIVGTYGAKSESASKLQRLVEEARKLLSPPVLGSILGVVVGGVPLCRTIFFSGGVLSPVWGALQTLGTAYLPAAVLVLAGSLVGPGGPTSKAGNSETVKNGESDGLINGDSASATSSNNPSARALISILASRFLLAPVLSFGLLSVLSQVGLLGQAGTRARAIVTYVLLCEGCMPPNQNSVIMLQLEGLKDRAQTMAKLLTIIYSIAVIPVTLLLSACLAKSSIMSFL
jgi:auxin efflux carrier family protein